MQTAAGERIRFNSAGASQQPRIELIRDGGVDYSIQNSLGVLEIQKDSNNIYRYASDTHQFYIAGGSERMRLDSTGVGIGADTPSTTLNVRGTKNYTGTTPSESSFECSIRSNTATVGIGSYNGIPSVQGMGSGTSYNVALCPANGSVGVGFELPEEKLDVDGNLRVRGNLIVDGTGAGYSTPSEVLNAIKTVDGSGSGLDADRLQGVSAGSLLRSDANDTATGQLTFNGIVNIGKEIDMNDKPIEHW